MSTGFWGSGGFGNDPLEEFLAQFFGGAAQPVARLDLGRVMSQDARELMRAAAAKAAELGSPDLDTEHLLWAMTQREPVRDLLSRAGADPVGIAAQIDERDRRGAARQEPPVLTPAAKRVLLQAHQISRRLGASYLGPEHILLALMLNRESEAGRLLAEYGITPESLRAAAEPGGGGGGGAAGGAPAATGTPTLDRYGRDLTAMARDGRIDPVVGRSAEIEQCVEVLARRTKNNPVLIGEAGVGKTAIVEGLAQRIVDGEVPRTLSDKRLVQLDLTGMVAGTRYRGDFEERVKNLIEEVRDHPDDLIVFIDEIHTVVGAGSGEGATDAANMLKPALSRGELHVVGATTLDEYRRYIEKDAALERRFQPILVPEPSVDDTVAILRGLRDTYEAHHGVRFTDEALVAAAELSDRYIADRFLPDKAIDLVDQAGARVQLRSRAVATDARELERQIEQLSRDKDQAVAAELYERASELRDQITALKKRADHSGEGHSAVPEVTAEDIAEVVSRLTGIPARQLSEEEKDRLSRLEERLHERLIGQDEAVSAVAQAIRRSRTGLGDPNRPIGSFLFLGPTGVGKTELARALAETLFGDQDRMVRLDMSEFQERHTASRLVGAPPGYVGHEEAGELTEAVRRNPYSVVLLDEIEKAHHDVFNTLLQVLDDGRLTDGHGRTVDFTNTVLIMTSNLGSEIISSRSGAIGFSSGPQDQQDLDERLQPRLREEFRPEFLNRLDEVLVFRRLSDEQLHEIADHLLGETRDRLREREVEVEFSSAAVDRIAAKGHQPEFGARPLRRTIEHEVEDRISDLLLDDQLQPGQRLRVDVADGELTFEVSEPAVR